MSASRYTVAIGVRALSFAALAFLAIELAVVQRLYGTALVVAVVATVVFFDLGRFISRGDRLLENFIDGLAAGHFEMSIPPSMSAGFQGFNAAITRAAATLHATRLEKQRQIEFLQSLLDNVSVACLVLRDDGALSLANRAARRLADQTVHQLEQVTAIGSAAATSLLALNSGERRVVRLANGHRVLACAARFAAGGTSYRLLSLENIGTELDTAELKAWQELVRILSHEMLNSLTPISSLAASLAQITSGRPNDASLVLSQKQTTRLTQAIETIARRSMGLMKFVEKYRKVAVMPQVELRAVTVSELLQNVETLLSDSLKNSNVVLSSRVEPSDLTVLADHYLLEQALINVVQNAADAVRGVSVPQISVHCCLRGKFAAISIKDNGAGVDANLLERIFLPFFTTKLEGSGIGLSLTRQIMLAHHGHVEVAANQPRGAVFTLLTPATSSNVSEYQ
jgi:nitrogen fixation/metabolism regulation signal transduction histidine kinase